MAENLAAEKILPQLGFSRLVHISAFWKLFPFDIVGTLERKKTLVDVTTCMSKSGTRLSTAAALATALGMRFFVLFIRPNLKQFALKEVEKGRGVYCSPHDLESVVN